MTAIYFITQLTIMRKSKVAITGLILFSAITAKSQAKPIDAVEFFKDDRVINMTLTVDMKNLVTAKRDTNNVPATVTMAFPDSTVITEDIKMKPKGEFRRKNCYIASLQLDFKKQGAPLTSLKKIKLIGGCSKSSSDEQLLLKEYLTYKIYNLFTDMSFRVRLLNVTYKDSREKAKPYTQYAFMIEDFDEMAKRNQCVKRETGLQNEQTDRKQMTLVSFFQYMIGNTDWSVPTLHNIKLIKSKKDSLAVPFVIPFDFDYTGFVNASYALPPEMFNTTAITERVYRGFARSPEEVEAMRNFFLSKEAAVRSVITDCKLLEGKVKKEALEYIDEFYRVAKSQKQSQSEFIDKARN